MNTIGKGWEAEVEDENDRASRRFPSTSVGHPRDGGPSLHVYDAEDGEWCVWLNPDAADFTGLCIGIGATRDEAVADAVRGLEAAVARLQGPAW